MPLKYKYNEEKPDRCDEHPEEQQPMSGKMQPATTTKSADERGQDMESELETSDEISTLMPVVVKKPTRKKLLGLRNRIESIGRRIYDKITPLNTKNSVGTKPIMIPPIPNLAFIDKFPDGMTLEGLNLAKKNLQEGYEAEVKLYRRLENLQESVLVLHGLEYTHDQCSVYLQNHLCSNMHCSKILGPHLCHKLPKQIEGECDFVLIGDNYVVLFEVKGVDFEDENDPDNALKFHGSCKDGMRQIQRMKKLIKAVFDKVQIFEFVVFSNLSLKECLPVIGEGNVYTETFLNSLVFSDNLDNFDTWFDSEVTQKVLEIELDSAVLKINLLGLWCIDSDNRYDITSCTLHKCAWDGSNKLKRSRAVDRDKVKQKITLGKETKCRKGKNKNYPSNPGITDAPELLNLFWIEILKPEIFEDFSMKNCCHGEY